MEKELVKEPIGSVGEVSIDISAGKLTLKAGADVGPANLAVVLSVDANKVIDLIEAKIPGQIDDAILEVMRAAILK